MRCPLKFLAEARSPRTPAEVEVAEAIARAVDMSAKERQ